MADISYPVILLMLYWSPVLTKPSSTTRPVIDEPPQAKISNAEQVIKTPQSSVTIYGNQSYDDHGIASFRWTRTDTDTGLGCDMSGTLNRNLYVSGLQEGRYEFMLTVMDTAGQTSSAMAVVIVKKGSDYGISCPRVSIPAGYTSVISSNPLVVSYECQEGYILSGTREQKCRSSGYWDPPETPVCLKQVTCDAPHLINGHCDPYCDPSYPAGRKVYVKCDTGYQMEVDDVKKSEEIIQCSQDGKWVTTGNWSVFVSRCVPSDKPCGDPPDIPNTVIEKNTLSPFKSGSKVYYRCDLGYSMIQSTPEQYLQCNDGHWDGQLPSCIPLLSCKAPDKIMNGEVIDLDSHPSNFYMTYPEGSRVQYRCNPGYKIRGTSVIECSEDRQWNHMTPECIDENVPTSYCPKLSPLTNGHCYCLSSQELEYCEPFYDGLHIRCTCVSGYKLVGENILTCKSREAWDYSMPYCAKVEDSVVSTVDTDEDQFSHISPLAIVVATACSVLGILLLIMVIMMFRRRKPHPRLCHPSTSVPPPYSRVHSNSLDEQDRMLLIGYSGEQRPPLLPTYEEATSGRNHTNTSHFTRSPPIQPGEYRPLPSIPSTLRGTSNQSGSENTNRHSVTTTSTVNRDGLSEVFGSLDTVNVSVSDASTAVTIETFDSGASHQSNMSGRATAGSLGSSNGSLANEDAPLLDHSIDQQDEEINNTENEEDKIDKTDDD